MALLKSSRALRRKNPRIPGFGWIGQEALISNDTVCDRRSNWPPQSMQIICETIMASDEGLGHDSTILLAGFTITGLQYGLLHLLAWDSPFATNLEEVLWRFSAIFIASLGFCLLELFALHDHCDPTRYTRWQIGAIMQQRTVKVVHLVYSILFTVFFRGHVFAGS